VDQVVDTAYRTDLGFGSSFRLADLGVRARDPEVIRDEGIL
jgi:hypothetical protein